MPKKAIKRIVGTILCLGVVILCFIFFYNKVCLWQEAKKYPPIGSMEEVNGHKMHVYGEGEGADTLVFLTGWATSSPTWDFKGLYSLLSDQYRIVVVERAGYGYSEASNSPRDLNTVLDETRSALEQAGESGPFIVVPHSMGGVEAIYWAQQYPAEVKAIVGLDMSFPETYKDYTKDLIDGVLKEREREAFRHRFGFNRFKGDFFEGHEPIMFGLLTEDETARYKALVYKSFYTKDMLREISAVISNAEMVGTLDPPKAVPMLLFIATEQGEAHTDLSLRYLSNMETGDHQVLDGGHYIHDFEPEAIAEKMIEFLSTLT